MRFLPIFMSGYTLDETAVNGILVILVILMLRTCAQYGNNLIYNFCCEYPHLKVNQRKYRYF
jgi:hypothetical protein